MAWSPWPSVPVLPPPSKMRPILGSIPLISRSGPEPPPATPGRESAMLTPEDESTYGAPPRKTKAEPFARVPTGKAGLGGCSVGSRATVIWSSLPATPVTCTWSL